MNIKDFINTLEESLETFKEKQIENNEMCLWGTKNFFEEMINCLKQDLERKEQLEKENQKLRDKLDHRTANNHYIGKLLVKHQKAIEIIKGMDIWLNYDEEEFNGSIEINGYFEITKEQYELLKEVLSNER